MQRLAGSWRLAEESLTLPGGKTVKSWGEKPLGYLSFDPAGQFSLMMMRADLPRFETRTGGTPEQNEAIAKGVIAYYGDFTAGEDGASVVMKIAGSTFAAFSGTTSRRPLQFRGESEMVMHVTVPTSNVQTHLVWRRAPPP